VKRSNKDIFINFPLRSISLYLLKNDSAVIMSRKTMKDFTFSDGTTIPAGNVISIAASCMHTDPVKILRTSIHVRLRVQDNYVDPDR
jgi:hypothetical protein